MPKLFTSESVSHGHPDKLADGISDTILDLFLSKDKNSRVAVETMLSGDTIYVVGEVRSLIHFSNKKIIKAIRKYVCSVGYSTDESSFNGNTVKIKVKLIPQSPEIASGVDGVAIDGDPYELLGAGDQGLMFGGAVNETKELMPASHALSNYIIRSLQLLTKNSDLLYPDAKTQVTVKYDNNGLLTAVDTIIVSIQHDKSYPLEELRFDIRNHLNIWIKEFIESQKGFSAENLNISKTKFLINPAGTFNIGGPASDAGLTGRKIIVDTYGGYFRHGGGAFSGKDYTKVDRSAAYAARWIAKNIVAAKLAEKIEIQLSYAIGVAEPVSIDVESYGTNKIPNSLLCEAIANVFDLRPLSIIEDLNLKEQKYQVTSSGGHFGREHTKDSFSWENLDKVNSLLQYVTEHGLKDETVSISDSHVNMI